jgi:hypothetical protein
MYGESVPNSPLLHDLYNVIHAHHACINQLLQPNIIAEKGDCAYIHSS